MDLYRGICLKFDTLINFDFNDDLIVPYEPIIDDQGRKCVADGNEYGIYMTDNKEMALDVYGNVHSQGQIIDYTIRMDGNKMIGIPAVGITYHINGDRVNARHPFITSVLQGHYNNGFMGDEWIADKITRQDFKIIRVIIGEDILHDCEEVPLTDDYKLLKEQVLAIIKSRISRLNDFINYLRTLDPRMVRLINGIDLGIYKKIFGVNGYKYIREEDIDISTFDGVFDALCYAIYKENPEQIKMSDLRTLISFRTSINKVPEDMKIATLEQLFINKIKDIEAKIKEKADQPSIQLNFQKSRDNYQHILDLFHEILSRSKKDEPKKY